MGGARWSMVGGPCRQPRVEACRHPVDDDARLNARTARVTIGHSDWVGLAGALPPGLRAVRLSCLLRWGMGDGGWGRILWPPGLAAAPGGRVRLPYAGGYWWWTSLMRTAVTLQDRHAQSPAGSPVWLSVSPVRQVVSACPDHPAGDALGCIASAGSPEGHFRAVSSSVH